MSWERPEFWWILLFCVGPVWIYWFFRRPARRVHWAAMRFLREAIGVVRRKTRTLEILQILFQTLVVLLVAVAMLLPFLPERKDDFSSDASLSNSDAAERWVVYVLDDSGSMQASFLSPQLAVSEPLSRFELARRTILKMWKAHAPGEVGILFPALGEPSAPTSDLSKAQAWLREREASVADVDWKTVCARLETLAQTHSPLEVRIFSDFQWNPADAKEIAASLRRLAKKASWTAVPIYQKTQNLAITQILPSRMPILKDEEAELRLTLENLTLRDVTHQKIELSAVTLPTAWGTTPGKVFPAGHVSVAQQWVDVPAGETREVVFPYRFSEEPTVLQISLLPNDTWKDGFPLDNSVLFCASPKPKAKFLLVESWKDDFHQRFTSGNDFLEAALRGIFSQRIPTQEETVTVERATDMPLATWHLPDFDTIFLHDTENFDAEEVAALGEYVHRGGTLFFFTGKQTAERGVLAEILPGEPQSWVETKTATEAFRLDVKGYAHPWLQAFRPFAPTGLETLPISAFARCSPRPGDDVVLALTDGAPWVFRRTVGAGTVLRWTSLVDTQQNVFPLTSMYIPVLERFLYHATVGTLQRENRLASPETSLLAGIYAEPGGTLFVVQPNLAETQRERVPCWFGAWQEQFAPGMSVSQANFLRILEENAESQYSLAPWFLVSAAGFFVLSLLLRFFQLPPTPFPTGGMR